MPRGIAFEGNSSQLGREIITVSQGLTEELQSVWARGVALHVYVSEWSALFCFTQRNNILMVFS